MTQLPDFLTHPPLPLSPPSGSATYRSSMISGVTKIAEGSGVAVFRTFVERRGRHQKITGRGPMPLSSCCGLYKPGRSVISGSCSAKSPVQVQGRGFLQPHAIIVGYCFASPVAE